MDRREGVVELRKDLRTSSSRRGEHVDGRFMSTRRILVLK